MKPLTDDQIPESVKVTRDIVQRAADREFPDGSRKAVVYYHEITFPLDELKGYVNLEEGTTVEGRAEDARLREAMEAFYCEFEKRTGRVDDLCGLLGENDALACIRAALRWYMEAP